MLERLHGNEIAVIGMGCRFPGARNIREFWKNLRDGIESIRPLSDGELREVGVDQDLLSDPNYVKVSAFLGDSEAFDAAFFGMGHREAEITDPQHRVLLECAWTALEDAGYSPMTYPGAIGVFAGATINTYALFHLAANPDILKDIDPVQLNIANAGDFLTTRIAYKLNLRGPCYTIQSACSTSLVAVHTACESLLNEQCDMALAGGVSVNVSLRHGYRYLEGGMTSPDGHCRPFDANGRGTVFGSGAGIVVLKRLEDALAEGDHIYTVILGSAVNNDGSLKIGYTAPSVDGQAQVISEALANAGVSASTVSYIEAHGTATPLGDPIEIQALTKAFRAYTDATGFCAIGSVKSNIGHLDAAAGIAGLIKTALNLKHKKLSPSLHFDSPNPDIDLNGSPFYVNTSLKGWEVKSGPRRAGISALGVGGTNAHVILQECPLMESTSASRPYQLITLSARTETALNNMTANLSAYLAENLDINLADVAYTLQRGRQGFDRRRFVVACDVLDAISALNTSERQFTEYCERGVKTQSLTFLFPGQGAQYVNMGRHLYEHELVFRQQLDSCASIIKDRFGVELLTALYPEPEEESNASARLQETVIAQPALFAVEYALARLWLSWGVHPNALIGHSLGEYVAACLSGVFTLEDALVLVTRRGYLVQDLPKGLMLAAPLSERELRPFLSDEVAIAAINGPSRCTIAGSSEAIERLGEQLRREGVSFRLLQTSHAFHSSMMKPARGQLAKLVSEIKLQPPQLPYLSGITGRWITAEEATDPEYWAHHLCATVRFADNVAEVLSDEHAILLELGPGQTLSRLAKQHPACKSTHVIVPAMRHAEQSQHDVAVTISALGRLCLAGREPDWVKFYGQERRRRQSLPTYPFDRMRYWIDAASPGAGSRQVRCDLRRRAELDDWFYIPSWRRILPERLDYAQLAAGTRRWLLFADDLGIARVLSQQLKASGQYVVSVHKGESFNHENGVCTIDPARPEDYKALFLTLCQTGQRPDVIIHLWGVTNPNQLPSFGQTQQWGFFSLIYLLRSITQVAEDHDISLQVVSNQLFALTSQEVSHPEKSTLQGVAKVIPYEFPHIRCQVVDVSAPENGAIQQAAAQILASALSLRQRTIAYRGAQCWEQIYQPMPISPVEESILRNRGVYLLTGGLLEVGIDIAEHLAKTLQARLVLIEEENFPRAEKWDAWLAKYGSGQTISQRIQQARRLVNLGAEVLVLPANLAEASHMGNAVDSAIEQFGQINGVIHNARVIGERSFRTINDTGLIECEWQFVPKVHGTINLGRAVEGQPLDFCLLNSSLSSILGGEGMVSYAAANSFMDAYAGWQNRTRPGSWVSVNWDAWQDTQVAVISPEWGKAALAREEGIEAIKRILTSGSFEQVVVSTVDLQARTEKMRQYSALKDRRVIETDKMVRHPRPEMSTAYVPPGSDRERLIAEIWQKALGVEKIGMLDNFFDLGGDSLTAIQTVSELKKALQIDMPVISMYEGLTIRSLVKLLGDAHQEPSPEMAEPIAQNEVGPERTPKRWLLQQRQRVRKGRPLQG